MPAVGHGHDASNVRGAAGGGARTSWLDRQSAQVDETALRLDDTGREMAHHCLASRRAQSAHLVSLEIVHDHLPRDGVVNGDEDERR